MYLGGDDGLQTEIKFEKCKEGLQLFREESMQSAFIEAGERRCRSPLSPSSKAKEMFAISEVISTMSGMRMDDQRCSLTKLNYSKYHKNYKMAKPKEVTLKAVEVSPKIQMGRVDSNSELLDMIQSLQVSFVVVFIIFSLMCILLSKRFRF